MNKLLALNGHSAGDRSPVAFDQRSFLIRGRRELLISGEIHYARSPRQVWPALLDRSVACGLNCIASYVFWNWHEPQRDVYDFSGGRDLGHFLGLCAERGLHVILRGGPYCCAEWNYGGFPPYLRDEPGITIRTFNKPYLDRVAKYFRHLAGEVRPYLASQGGPVIMVQVENEYNNVASRYGEDGRKYLQWLRDLAISVGFDVPLVMCEGGVEGTIETVNGFSISDTIVSNFRKRHPNLPLIWTELWPGWYDTWGYQRHLRDASNIAYHVLRFVSAGGSGINYYMWHGGTNLSRTSMYLQATAYGFDAPLDEFGGLTEKAVYLSGLHKVLLDNADVLLSGKRVARTAGPNTVHTQWQKGRRQLHILINTGADAVEHNGISVLSQNGCVWDESGRVLFDTAIHASKIHKSFRTRPWRRVPVTLNWQSWDEPRPGQREDGITSPQPIEQLSLTQDTSDYCWYSTTIHLAKSGRHVIRIPSGGDFLHVFVQDKLIGGTALPLLENRGRPVLDTGEKLSSEVNPLEQQQSHYQHTFTISAKAGEYRLDILATALGLVKGDWQVSGPMNLERRGIWADVLLDGKVLRQWTMHPGLIGERLNLAGTPQAVEWRDAKRARALRWHRAEFTLLPRLLKADADLRLDATGLGKGMLFLNGHGLGRHWLIEGRGYGGDEGWQDQKLNGLSLAAAGEPTQRYYRLPQCWLARTNTLIVFEEMAAVTGDVCLEMRKP